MSAKAVIHTYEPFATGEYEQRLARARKLMEADELDALLITTEANFRYFSGLHSQNWVSPTRPMFLVLGRDRAPIAVIPTGSRVVMRQSSWIADVRTWMAPKPSDDGVTLLIEALSEAVGRKKGRIGAEFGPETQVRMPLTDFFRVQKAMQPTEFVDGSAIPRRLRMVKSAGEIARVRAAAQLVSAGFEALPGMMHIGDSERDICLAMQIDLLRRGAENIQYMIAASGPEGYATINTNPSDRRVGAGDLFIIDTGSTIDGYFCDFDRNYAFGAASDAARRAHALVYEATDAGIAAARPGALLCDVWQAMARTMGKEAIAGSDVGRMGHGLGLNLTEPPSVHPDDRTVIEADMVLTIEPGIGYTAADGKRRVMVHEENLVVRANGAELLSRRAPPEMPVIR